MRMLAELVLFAILIASQAHSSSPGGEPTALTASAGSESAYLISQGVKRMTIHPRLDVYLRTTSKGPVYKIASGAYMVLDAPGMGGKTILFESLSGTGNVELFEEVE